MRTRSSCLGGCVCILRFLSFVSARTISTRFLSWANKVAKLKNLLEVLLIPSHLFNLTLQRRHLAAKPQPLRHDWPDASARSPIGKMQTPIGRPIGEGVIMVPTPPKIAVPASLARRDYADLEGTDRDEQPPPSTPTRYLELIFPALPQPLVESHGGQRSQVERILNSRGVKGQQTSYLVRWRDYPPSHDSWAPRA